MRCDAVLVSVGRCCVFVVTGWPMICASADWYRVSPPGPVSPPGESPPIGSIDASSGSVLGVAGKFARASRSARSFLDGMPIDRFIFLYAISSGDFFLEADAMASSVTPDAAPAVAQRSLALRLVPGVECGSFFALMRLRPRMPVRSSGAARTRTPRHPEASPRPSHSPPFPSSTGCPSIASRLCTRA